MMTTEATTIDVAETIDETGTEVAQVGVTRTADRHPTDVGMTTGLPTTLKGVVEIPAKDLQTLAVEAAAADRAGLRAQEDLVDPVTPSRDRG